MQKQYQLQGHIVTRMTHSEIQTQACRFTKIISVDLQQAPSLEQLLELIQQYAYVTLDPIDNKEWFFATEGHFDPHTRIIRIPEKTYQNACNGDGDALFIIFHEVGHAILAHQPVLHHSKSPTELDDSEWQADTFSYALLESLGISRTQYRLPF